MVFTQLPIIPFGDTVGGPFILEFRIIPHPSRHKAVQADGIFILTAYMQITASALQVLRCFSSIGIPEMAQLLYAPQNHRSSSI